MESGVQNKSWCSEYLSAVSAPGNCKAIFLGSFLGSRLSKNSAFVHPELRGISGRFSAINSGFLSVSSGRNAGSFSHSFSPDCMVWSVLHSLEGVKKKLFFWMKGLIISLIQNNKRSFFSSEWNMLPLYHIHLRVLSFCLINIHVLAALSVSHSGLYRIYF